MIRQSWRKWKRFELNNNATYFSIIFANTIKSTYIKLLCKVNVMWNVFTTIEATPDSRQKQNQSGPTIGVTTASLYFFLSESP
jgi:hypothetical protein